MKRARVALLALLAVAPLFAQTTMPSIEQVKEKHAARLLALPGVVSVGIGPLRIEVIGPVRAR